MNARELDALVAEKVMGFRREKTPPDCEGKYGGEDVLIPPTINHKTWNYPPKGRIGLAYFVPHYSTDIAAWNKVSIKIKEIGKQAEYLYALAELCGIEAKPNYQWSEIWAFIDAPLEKKCLAALKAKGIEVGKEVGRSE